MSEKHIFEGHEYTNYSGAVAARWPLISRRLSRMLLHADFFSCFLSAILFLADLRRSSCTQICADLLWSVSLIFNLRFFNLRESARNFNTCFFCHECTNFSCAVASSMWLMEPVNADLRCKSALSNQDIKQPSRGYPSDRDVAACWFLFLFFYLQFYFSQICADLAARRFAQIFFDLFSWFLICENLRFFNLRESARNFNMCFFCHECTNFSCAVASSMWLMESASCGKYLLNSHEFICDKYYMHNLFKI